MSDAQNFAFGKFVPGFDFLQNLAKGAGQAMPQMPGLSNWVAPTLSVEELDKRIDELRAVHFWLDQNSKALAATVQALQVQKMTLATLKGMNLSMAELAESMKMKTGADVFAAAGQQASEPARARPAKGEQASADTSESQEPSPSAGGDAASAKAAGAAPSGVIDPLQWWGALTQQFQEIAASAMQGAGQKGALDAARELATGMADQTMKAASQMAEAAAAGMGGAGAADKKAAAPRAGAKAAAKKTGARSASARAAAKTPRGA